MLFDVAGAHACAACAGAADTDLAAGAKAGIWVMAAVTYGLLSVVGGMVAFWGVRARRLRLEAQSPGAADDRTAS